MVIGYWYINQLIHYGSGLTITNDHRVRNGIGPVSFDLCPIDSSYRLLILRGCNLFFSGYGDVMTLEIYGFG